MSVFGISRPKSSIIRTAKLFLGQRIPGLWRSSRMLAGTQGTIINGALPHKLGLSDFSINTIDLKPSGVRNLFRETVRLGEFDLKRANPPSLPTFQSHFEMQPGANIESLGFGIGPQLLFPAASTLEFAEKTNPGIKRSDPDLITLNLIDREPENSGLHQKSRTEKITAAFQSVISSISKTLVKNEREAEETALKEEAEIKAKRGRILELASRFISSTMLTIDREIEEAAIKEDAEKKAKLKKMREAFHAALPLIQKTRVINEHGIEGLAFRREALERVNYAKQGNIVFSLEAFDNLVNKAIYLCKIKGKFLLPREVHVMISKMWVSELEFLTPEVLSELILENLTDKPKVMPREPELSIKPKRKAHTPGEITITYIMELFDVKRSTVRGAIIDGRLKPFIRRYQTNASSPIPIFHLDDIGEITNAFLSRQRSKQVLISVHRQHLDISAPRALRLISNILKDKKLFQKHRYMNRLSLRDGKLSYAIHGLAERHYSVFEKLWRSDIEWEFGPSLVGLVDKWLEKAPQDMQADMCSWALEQGFYKIDGPLANKIDTVLEANIFAYKEICSSSVISLPYRIKFHLIWERKEAQTEKEQAINLEIGNYLFSEISSGNIKDISERTCKYLIRTSWAWRLFASNRSKTTELRTKALALILKDENLIAKFSKDGRSNVRRGFKTDIKRFIKNQDVDLPARIKAAVLLQREDLELPAKPLIEELKRKSWKSFGEPQVKDIAEFLGLDEKLTGKLVKIHKRAIRTNYDFRNAFKGILTFSEQAGLSFPEAFETIESLMRILPNKKFRIIDITKKALSQIPKGETLSDLRSKYPAIPLDTFCQCICFVNGMERQRVLANFNTVFSAKKIRKAVTKKLAIRKALTNIYLSGSKNNMKAVIELLLMVEEGFGKSQQSPFIEALGYIESLGEFGDLIDNIKKRTAHAEG